MNFKVYIKTNYRCCIPENEILFFCYEGTVIFDCSEMFLEPFTNFVNKIKNGDHVKYPYSLCSYYTQERDKYEIQTSFEYDGDILYRVKTITTTGKENIIDTKKIKLLDNKNVIIVVLEELLNFYNSYYDKQILPQLFCESYTQNMKYSEIDDIPYGCIKKKFDKLHQISYEIEVEIKNAKSARK